MSLDQIAVLDTVARFLRMKGIPCGAWKMPQPDEIEAAQAKYGEELERIIEEMRRAVPRMLAQQ